ncbi:hypothetical protein Sjap_009729 [Stephania japonica]|uniref:Uncharacterized protein n=1 Tax=Stephania japonica TaxID=461633 RepID=A0AAP0JAE1_9MAGN
MGIHDRSSRVISAFLFTFLRIPLSHYKLSHRTFHLSETFLQTPCDQCGAFELHRCRLFHTLSRPPEEEEQVQVEIEASAGTEKSSHYEFLVLLLV